MPELLEVERYARLARPLVGRRVISVDGPDPWYLKGGLDAVMVSHVLEGGRVAAVRRIGKLLLIDVERAVDPERATIGLRFGMTGRLFVDGVAGIDNLEYGSSRMEPAWERFRITFDQGTLVMLDPRRLGGVALNPTEASLGPDAWSITLAALQDALERGGGPLKARLMDQARIAGLGNLLTDETLWRSRLSPARVAGGLSTAECRRLHRTLRKVLDNLDQRGGSHRGDLQAARHRGGHCPRCGDGISWATIGGRSTYWCRRCVMGDA